MQENIIARLYGSFAELEQAIHSAKDTLRKRESVPQEILTRLDSYDGILEKQRRLADSLCEHIKKEDWSEVARVVNVINGLSAMIRDDARAILSSLSLNSDYAEGDDKLVIC